MTTILKSKNVIDNKDRYRTANEKYYAVFVLDSKYELVPCLLTEDNVVKGIERAENNKEDVPKISFIVSWFYKVMKKLRS